MAGNQEVGLRFAGHSRLAVQRLALAPGVPLDLLIGFAYKLNGDAARYTREHLPGWATTERFDVEARAAGNPTKDQVRLMMQSLLAERFHLAGRFKRFRNFRVARRWTRAWRRG
jgi:uncharacterized protein (TIGR03435 family)